MPQTSTDHKTTAVVYLCWMPYGIEYFQRFISSYKNFDSGLHHQLVILFNGSAQADATEFIQLAKEQLPQAKHLSLPQGQDIDAYFFAAGQLKEERILFLNSYSEFTAPNWLLHYDSVFRSEKKIGLVGATASNQSLYTLVFEQPKHWERNKTFGANFKKYKLFIKAFLFWRRLIAPFPNPHIRTNAFMIDRALFLSLQHKKLSRKFDAYLFESGRRSLTRQVLEKDWQARVVDREGKSFPPEAWRDSRTFWWSEQERVLITDNQTELYATANERYRQYLRHISWGA